MWPYSILSGVLVAFNASLRGDQHRVKRAGWARESYIRRSRTSMSLRSSAIATTEESKLRSIDAKNEECENTESVRIHTAGESATNGTNNNRKKIDLNFEYFCL